MTKTYYRIGVSIAWLAASLHGADTWHETKLGGKRVGYLHERIEPAGGGFVSTAESRMVIGRLESKVEIRATVRCRESATGRLLAVHSEITSSQQSTVMDGDVGDGSVAIRISTGGKSYDRKLPFNGDLLGSEGARLLTLARLKAPGDSVTYQMFTPELGTVAEVKRTVASRDANTLRVQEEIAGIPGTATLWLDADARMLRRVQPGPLGDVELVLTTQEQAKVEPGESELFSSSIVTSNVKLPEEREIESVRIRVTQKKPELGWPDLSGEYQTVVEKSAKSVVIETRRPKLADMKPYLAPNALFQSDDAEVVRIAREVAGANRNTFATALALRDWTASHVRFDAGIAIAPASEVVRNRAGTCFGYSILLGSLARAAGIPSRLKMGFVYAHGIWGGHAWIEVSVNGQWIPIDAALPSSGIADAARFSFFTSSLEEGTLAGMGSLAQMYGNVEIEILGYTLHGKAVTAVSK